MSTLILEIKLNSSNYHSRKTHISFIFYFKHMLDVAIDASIEPTATTTQDKKDEILI